MKALVFLVLLFNVAKAQLTISGNIATFQGVDTVYVNGVPTPYLIEYCYDTLPFNTSILFDNSGSLDLPYQPPYSALDFEKKIVTSLSKLSKSYILATGNTSNQIVADTNVACFGGTDIYNMITGPDGLLETTPKIPEKRLAVLITDGWDSPFNTLGEVYAIIDSCNKYNIHFYTFLVTQTWISYSVQWALKYISESTGGLCFDKLDQYDKLELVIDSLERNTHKYPCRVRFLLDSCEQYWRIQIGTFDTLVKNPNYWLTYKTTRDTVSSECDTTITIKEVKEGTCYYWDSTYSYSFAGQKSDTSFTYPDTVYRDPCKDFSFAYTRTIVTCDSIIQDTFITSDTLYPVVVLTQYTDSLSIGKEYFLDVSICDTGYLLIPATNEKCLPLRISIKGGGAFRCNVYDTLIPPFSAIQIPFTYYPSGKDTSIYLIGDSVVSLYGTSYNPISTIKPDSIFFSRSICDSSPEFYSIITVSCDTSVREGAFVPILTEGSHSDIQDGIHFIYSVYDSSRVEVIEDGCTVFTLTIGCDTVITRTEKSDTVYGFISYEHLDTSRVRITSTFPVVSSTDLLTYEYGDIWRFYLGKDSFAVLSLAVDPKPCTVYILETDTVFYQYFCGDRLLRDFMEQPFRIYPNPSTGEFKILPEPETMEVYFQGVKVQNLNASGEYFVIVNRRVVLKLIVKL